MSVVTTEPPSLSSTEVARLSRVSYRQLDYWMRKGLLVPMRRADGSGSSHRYSPRDLAAAEALGRLSILWDHQARPSRDAVLGRLVAHIRARGCTGTVELVPGLIVDLDRLVPPPERFETR